jgi:serine/threonine protein kinase
MKERYTNFQQINETGNSVIYRAADTKLNRDVVVKKIKNLHSELKIRMEREIKILSKLEHPNIVPIYDSFEDENNNLYYVMRYIQGKELTEFYKSRDSSSYFPIFSNILSVMSYIHKNNIIHRDLKPSNILVDSNGSLYILDFGIAKDLGEDLTRITRTGQYIGTQNYSAPEQEAGMQISNRTDIYSLGMIFYELVNGKKLIRDNLPKKITDPFLKIILKMTELKPDDRYPDCETIQKDLDKLSNNPNKTNKSKRFFRFIFLVFIIGLVTIFLLLLLIIVFLNFSSQSNQSIPSSDLQMLKRKHQTTKTIEIPKQESELVNHSEKTPPPIDTISINVKTHPDGDNSIYYSTRDVKLRKEPNTKSTILEHIPIDTNLKLIKTDRSEYSSVDGKLYFWYYFPEKRGYIYGKYVEQRNEIPFEDTEQK